jgi:hypothetical protein
MAAWQSTAIAWADPEVRQGWNDLDDETPDADEVSRIERPGA